MTNGHGGYRRPANPAPVSGPGAHSQRTDGQVVSTMPGQPYGQAQQDHAVESLIPMGAQKPMPAAASVAAPGGQTPPAVPQYQGGDFAGPTARPDEPVTAGAPAGPGPGLEALGGAPDGPMSLPTGYVTNTLRQLAATDNTGLLADLYLMAEQRGA